VCFHYRWLGVGRAGRASGLSPKRAGSQTNYMWPARGVHSASMSCKRRLSNRVLGNPEEEGIPEVLAHRGYITDSAEETILTVNDDVSVTTRIGFFVRDDNCNLRRLSVGSCSVDRDSGLWRVESKPPRVGFPQTTPEPA
jgi:hypothetical protein